MTSPAVRVAALTQHAHVRLIRKEAASTEAGVPTDLFTTGRGRWIGLTVRGEAEQPRIMMVSVPYAAKAGDAETIGGRPAADFVLSGELRERIRSALTDLERLPERSERPASTSSLWNSARRVSGNAAPTFEVRTNFPSEALHIKAPANNLLAGEGRVKRRSTSNARSTAAAGPVRGSPPGRQRS